MNIQKRFKNSLLLVGLLTLSLLPMAETGCKSTLEGGGAYAPVTTNVDGTVTPTQAPDKAFFVADAAFYLAYSAVDAAFTFERDNRSRLWDLDPNIKKSLDKVRPQAVQARNEYIHAREGYLLHPTPAGLSTIQTALAKIQQVRDAAQAVVPK